MRIEDHLSKKEKVRLKQITKPQQVRLSKKDLNELMGTNRQTYKRSKGGAFRSK